MCGGDLRRKNPVKRQFFTYRKPLCQKHKGRKSGGIVIRCRKSLCKPKCMKIMVMLGKYPVDKVVDSVEKLGFSTENPAIHLFFPFVNWWVFPDIYSPITAIIRVTETLFSHRKIFVFAESIVGDALNRGRQCNSTSAFIFY